MRSFETLDRFANWLCSQMWVLCWASTRGNQFAVRLHHLCIARIVADVSIGWRHVVGRHDVNDALLDHVARADGIHFKEPSNA